MAPALLVPGHERVAERVGLRAEWHGNKMSPMQAGAWKYLRFTRWVDRRATRHLDGWGAFTWQLTLGLTPT